MRNQEPAPYFRTVWAALLTGAIVLDTAVVTTGAHLFSQVVG